MKKIITSLFLIFTSLVVFSQSNYSISGKVIDATTKLPMQAASVFAENTTIGTATTPDGNFRLELPNGGYDLVVTFTGYQTETKRITTADAGNNNIVIELKQKEKALEDVVVRSTAEVTDGLAKYGEFFLDNFIGKTANSKYCTIKNKEVLKFYFYKRTNRLKILATAPLEIVNEALGYTIKYELDSFTHEYNTQVSQYTGSPLFEEMQTDNTEQKAKWNAARLLAYNGSILHFMRSLYNKKLKEEGFEIQFLITVNEKEMAIPVKDFYGGLNYYKEDSTQSVVVSPNQSEVVVIYKNEEPEQNYLAANPEQPKKFQLSVFSFIPKEYIVIEQNGYYFEQTDFTVNQYLAWEKVADMLPYNFSLK
ncbi:MAG: carboxypeptidase-like regulatory domain-containing protein [Ferruginibacter sp.]